jgi:hypothetical protein
MSAYDRDFENIRLQQLQKQVLSTDKIDGKIVFGCLLGSQRIDFSTWFFDAEQMKTLRENDFKTLIQPLIESIAEYRQWHNIVPCQDCILNVEASELHLE